MLCHWAKEADVFHSWSTVDTSRTLQLLRILPKSSPRIRNWYICITYVNYILSTLIISEHFDLILLSKCCFVYLLCRFTFRRSCCTFLKNDLTAVATMKLMEFPKIIFDPQITRDAKQMSVATSRFARAVSTQWATLSGVPVRGGGERERETRAEPPFPTLAEEDRCRGPGHLKDFEGSTLFGNRRSSLRRNKRTQRYALVRPLYYLSRCYSMNAQYIIWIADKGHDLSRVPENFCIFASYVTASLSW